MKYLPIAAVLLLGGCLEAADLMAGGVRTETQYCQVPDGVVLCADVKDKRTAAPVVRKP